MKTVCFAVLIAFAFCAPSFVEDNAIPFKTCGPNHLGLSQVSLEPAVPVAGKPLVVKFSGTPEKEITSGSLDLDISLYGVKIATKSFNICQDLGVSCPLAAGKKVYPSISYEIPSEAPSGLTISVKAQAKDSTGADLSCVSMDVKMGSKTLLGAEESTGDNWGSFEPFFGMWKSQFNKLYETEKEDVHRFGVFLQNLMKVKEHTESNHEWGMALNEFADLAEDEFAVRYGLLGTNELKAGSEHVVSDQALPTSVDWREKKLVTDVKNQGSCGSCWAFSTIVSIEGQHAKQSGDLVSLSEQDLVDCVKKVSINGQECCDGCQGGLMDFAMKYLIDSQNGGDDTETSYPYTGSNGQCSFKSDSVGAKITGYVDVKQGDEQALKDAVANVGPVSVGVDANFAWQMYGGGIMDPGYFFGCSSDPSKMDHGVAVVGYGTENGKDYWIIKNSWGPSWGEKGYIRIAAGKNVCGVANAAIYPKV